MAEKLRIDFISDVVCPWCVIGLRSLAISLDRVGADAEFHLQPFELNPDMAPEGENVTEHVARKYGSSAERSQGVRQAIKDHGAALGFTFNYSPESRIWNTFDAHRLLHWAEIEGKVLALKEALFAANFSEGRNVSDHAVLSEVAQSVGLDGARALEILSTDAFARDVREAEMAWRQNGIQAVPSVLINQRWLIQGGQPPEVFAQVIRDVVSGKATEA